MAFTELRGVYPVVSTPFRADGSIDHEDVTNIIAVQTERGIPGVVLFGIAAEFYKLSDDEREAIVETAAAATRETPTTLIVSVTDHSTERAIDFARFAEDAGAEALMLLPPYFLGPSAADFERHVRRVGEAVDIPIMVQYAPEQTGVSVPPETFVALSRSVDSIQYFKIESRPPGPDISAIVDAVADDVGVLVGYAGLHMIEALQRGAQGVIPGASISHRYQEVWDRYTTGDIAGARDRHARLLPLITHTIQDIEGFIHYEKRMLAELGIIESTGTREPAFTSDPVFDAEFEASFDRIRSD